MEVLRSIVVVVAFPVLFATAGGFLATALDRLAPGYYAGVFPGATQEAYARSFCVYTGIFQGLPLGFLVGAVIALGLAGWQQLQWAVFCQALAIVAVCVAVFAVGGSLVGWGIGTLNPGYYRGVLTGGRLPGFNPVDVGIGLGCSQGVILGSIVGALVVIVRAWQLRPSNFNPDIERVVRARFEPTQPTSGTDAVRPSPNDVAEGRF